MTHLIDPAPDAPLGRVSSLAKYDLSTFPAGSAILCRNNAPLLAFAFDLLQRGQRCQILGRDLGAGLTKIIDKLKPESPQDLARKLPKWTETEVKRKKKPSAKAAVYDRADCLLAVANGCATLSEIRTKLKLLFETDGASLTLATGHKSKGLEWPNVFILDRHLCPGKWVESRKDKLQERNLMYVMITRAELNLTYIRSDCWMTGRSVVVKEPVAPELFDDDWKGLGPSLFNGNNMPDFPDEEVFGLGEPL